MEQAAETGREWLSLLEGLGIFPDGLLNFGYAKAELFQNLPDELFLPPEYGYWKVSFLSQNVYARITVGAVTGQAWEITVDSFRAEVNIADYDPEAALTAYMTALNIDSDKTEAPVISVSSSLRNAYQHRINYRTMKTPDDSQYKVVTVTGSETVRAALGFEGGTAEAEAVADCWLLSDGRKLISGLCFRIKNK
jgi:hypothetical protein